MLLRETVDIFHCSDLSFNEISLGIDDRISPFNRLKSLTRLNLHQNSIKFLSNQNFEGLTKLRLLQLSDNNITSIQANAFESLKELREL